MRSNAAEPITGRVCFFVITKGHSVIQVIPMADKKSSPLGEVEASRRSALVRHSGRQLA